SAGSCAPPTPLSCSTPVPASSTSGRSPGRDRPDDRDDLGGLRDARSIFAGESIPGHACRPRPGVDRLGTAGRGGRRIPGDAAEGRGDADAQPFAVSFSVALAVGATGPAAVAAARAAAGSRHGAT